MLWSGDASKLGLGVFSGFDYICFMWRVAGWLRAPFFSGADFLHNLIPKAAGDSVSL